MSKMSNMKRAEKKKKKIAFKVKQGEISKKKNEAKQKALMKKAKNQIIKIQNKGKLFNGQEESKSEKYKDVVIKEQKAQSPNKSKTSKKGKKKVQRKNKPLRKTKETVATDGTKSKFMLYVTNLGSTVDKNQLEEHFTTVAPVKKLLLFKTARKSRAILEFPTNEDCENALMLHGSNFQDHVITVVRSNK